MLKNNSVHYGIITKALHWIIAFLILFMYCTMYFPVNTTLLLPQKINLYFAHKSTGVLILILACARLIWRLINPTPQHIAPKWQVIIAKINFYLLYIIMFAMPISGIIMSIYAGHSVPFYGLFIIDAISEKNHEIVSIAKTFHYLWSIILLFSLFLHVCGGLYHVIFNLKSRGKNIFLSLYQMKTK